MPSIEGGGVEKNLVIISNYLARKILDISLITFDNKFNHLFDKKIKIKNVTKYKENKNYSKYFKYYKCLLVLIKEYYINKNILVFSFQANIYTIILSSIFKFDVLSRSNSSPSGWKSNYLKLLIFKFFFKFANEIVVNSKEFKKEFKRYFNINTKLIYNPLNKKEIENKSRERLKFKFFEKKNSIKIINIGRFTDQKDHFTLLESMKIIKNKVNVKLLIMGYGTNKIKISNFIKKNKLQKYIKIISFKKNPFNYLRKADILVLTSRYEGLPNVLLEAQVLKKYIISTNCPTGPKEILENGKLGTLIKIGDYKTLSDVILNFKKNKVVKKKINLAYKKIDRFDYKINCENYFNLIRKYI